MVDTSTIHAIIARARRRLRLQAALETATTTSILAFASALATVYAVRQGAVSASAGIAILVGCAAVVAIGALIGAFGRFPTHIVATRVDRASDLSDRLSTACAFERRLEAVEQGGANEVEDAQTRALMNAAIEDAVAAAPAADVAAATPFHRPRDMGAALSFGVVALLVSGLYWPHGNPVSTAVLPPTERVEAKPAAPEKADEFADDDIDYARDLLEDLRRVARTEREPNLEQFVRDVDNLLARAEMGELSKEQLLEELAKAEEQYMQGADDNVEQAVADLKETGRELKKNSLTREVGKALEKGDLNQARAEMEKLAQKLEQGQFSQKQQREIAKALDKAARKFDKKDARRDEKLDQQIAKQKDQIRKLQRKMDQAKNQREKQRLTRQLEKRKRELKRLEREREKRQRSAQRRTLKQLHRDMQQASKSMRQRGQKNRRMASRSLRSAARNTGKVDADRRKIAGQKKVASQLSDLKEAMRRARRRGRSGMRDLFGKNKRNQDFRRRARGQRGSRGAWRPGQNGPGRNGQKQAGRQPKGKGKQPGGSSYGDEHDPYLLGDATPKSGKTRDESASGVHGRGQSRRETILAAAQKGFSSRAYQNVFAEYKTIVEEVIRSEKVPSGYKYYVKRYFQKIKPHSMD